MADFVSVVMTDTEDVWHDLFEENNLTYDEPSLILFKNNVQSTCRNATSTVGPFYCPVDESIYIDLSFHQELQNTFEVTGDFATAYAVAQKVCHHVQNLLGISDQVHKLRNQLSEKEYNRVFKKLELQTHYFAGFWAHHQVNNQLLDPQDIPEAIQAASAIGDDKIQEKTLGYVVPDKFRHGTAKQRGKWFYKGDGKLQGDNTFEISDDGLW